MLIIVFRPEVNNPSNFKQISSLFKFRDLVENVTVENLQIVFIFKNRIMRLSILKLEILE